MYYFSIPTIKELIADFKYSTFMEKLGIIAIILLNLVCYALIATFLLCVLFVIFF